MTPDESMKRDMDVIRHLLLWVESDQTHEIPSTVSRQELAYHVQLLIDAGLVEAAVRWTSYRGSKVPDDFVIQRLTWAGHDFLDAARNDTNWKKAKDQILKTGSAWTFEILKELLVHYAKTGLGIP